MGLVSLLTGLIAVCESAQILIAACWVSLFFPIHSTLRVYVEFIDTLHPERDILLFRLFIGLSVGLFILIDFMVIRGCFKDQRLLLKSACLSVIACCLSGFGYINSISSPLIWTKEILGYFILAVWLLKVLLMMGFVSNFFKESYQRILIRGGIAVDIGILIFILSLIWVVDPQFILAYAFLSDGFLHIDTFVMGPACVQYLNGIIGIDTFSFYGVSLPVILASLGKICGGLTYELWINLYLSMMYLFFVAVYVFLRLFLQSRRWAMFWTLVVLLLQIFHSSIGPMPLNFPSGSVLRYFYFIFVLLCLWKYERRESVQWLYGAAILTGVSLTHFWDTGLYQLAAFYVYLLVRMFDQHRPCLGGMFKSIRSFCGFAVIPLGVAIIFLWGTSKGYFIQKIYWQNSFEQLHMVLEGWLANPFKDQIRDHQWGSFYGAFIFPVIYVFVLGHILSKYLKNEPIKDGRLMIFTSIFGICLYHYFVLHSVGTAYLSSSLPAIILLAWLCRNTVFFIGKGRTYAVLLFGFVLSLIFLSNDSFRQYPNIYALGNFDWKNLKKQYVDEAKFKDVDMIRELIDPQQKAAVISSYDVKFCLEAERLPFFYYIPIFRASLLSGNEFRGTLIYTKEMMRKIILPLYDHPPKYIFIERKIYEGRLQPEVYQYSTSLMEILNHVAQHYQPYRRGQYLVALQRKD